MHLLHVTPCGPTCTTAAKGEGAQWTIGNGWRMVVCDWTFYDHTAMSLAGGISNQKAAETNTSIGLTSAFVTNARPLLHQLIKSRGKKKCPRKTFSCKSSVGPWTRTPSCSRPCANKRSGAKRRSTYQRTRAFCTSETGLSTRWVRALSLCVVLGLRIRVPCRQPGLYAC